MRKSAVLEANNYIDTTDKPIRDLAAKAYRHHRAVASRLPSGSVYAASYQLNSKCRALEHDSLEYITYLISSKRLFEHLPLPIAETKTDADGNFAIDVPDRNRAVIASATTRAVFDKTESYHWLVRLAANPGKIMLSNDNIASAFPTGSPDHWAEAGASTPSLESITERLKQLETLLTRATTAAPAPRLHSTIKQ